MKLRFALIGAGWRAMYYVRIAKALPDHFECVGILCRTAEKAAAVEQNCRIPTVTSAEAIRNLNPDVVVVAVNKQNIASVAMEWMKQGFLVLSETPAALDIETMKQLWEVSEHGRHLVVAEQYLHYPENIARLALLKQGLIGEPQYTYLSLAHDYHGMSLLRAFLQVPGTEPYTIAAVPMEFPTVRTMTRQERVQDGTVFNAKRTAALIRFACGKAALYEFDPEQYRSTIRHNRIKIQGVSGEIADTSVRWLDQQFQSHQADINTAFRIVETDDENPNFQSYPEVTSISFNGEDMYQPPFGFCGLSQDETAIASMLEALGGYVRGEGDVPYPLVDALNDAAMAVDLQKAVESGTVIHSDQTLPWRM